VKISQQLLFGWPSRALAGLVQHSMLEARASQTQVELIALHAGYMPDADDDVGIGLRAAQPRSS